MWVWLLLWSCGAGAASFVPGQAFQVSDYNNRFDEVIRFVEDQARFLEDNLHHAANRASRWFDGSATAAEKAAYFISVRLAVVLESGAAIEFISPLIRFGNGFRVPLGARAAVRSAVPLP